MKKNTKITITVEHQEIEALILAHLIKKGEIPNTQHTVKFTSRDYTDYEHIEAVIVFEQE